MPTPIPTNWKQEEINEYFNIRLNTIEKYMGQVVVGFENVLPDEDAVNESTVLSAQAKAEILNNLEAIKEKVKKK